jgi:hypothetical protein
MGSEEHQKKRNFGRGRELMSRLPNSGEIGKGNYIRYLKNQIIIISLVDVEKFSVLQKLEKCISSFTA